MTAPAKTAVLTHHSGVDLKRFVVHSALLSLIDPVRGEPTRTSLDENPDGDISSGRQLKQKFLDSFALICSTSSSGAETASAVCLEQYAGGATLRVARNRGLTLGDRTGLEGILQILRAVARKGAYSTRNLEVANAAGNSEKSSMQAEPEILRLVVELDKGRILSVAEKVEKRGIRDAIRVAYSRFPSGQVIPGLRPWLECCPFTGAPPHTWTSATMAKLIEWASQARWLYPQQLQNLLGLSRMEKPPWMESLYKIARYRSAIKSMVKLAAKQPEVFSEIYIRAVEAPDQQQFSLASQKDPLLNAVQSLVKKDAKTTMEKLAEHLSTDNVEAQLRKTCKLKLTLHAEMQLVVFYESNPSSAPRMPFIGTSKKACFLCHEYLLQHPLHPLRLQVSACHQKIYPSWMPPPYHQLPGKFKSPPFSRLSRNIEQLTRRELRTALNAPRRPKNQDSTAGPSLTVTATASIRLG